MRYLKYLLIRIKFQEKLFISSPVYHIHICDWLKEMQLKAVH
jgi:hypothetical protein